MDPTQPTNPSNTAAQTTPQSQPKKNRWLAPLAGGLTLLALAVAGWMWWVHNDNQTAEETPAVAITITDTSYTPATVKIKKGQDVTWTNQSHIAQKLVGSQNKPKGLATNEALDFGDSYSFTFEDTGTYTYYDPAKTDHQGTIIVE